MTNLSDYWDMLNSHDWFHMYSDDGRVDRAGAANMDLLSKIAGESAEHTKMLLAFRAHNFSGNPFKTDKLPKPVRPEPLPEKALDGEGESW